MNKKIKLCTNEFKTISSSCKECKLNTLSVLFTAIKHILIFAQGYMIVTRRCKLSSNGLYSLNSRNAQDHAWYFGHAHIL